LVGSYRTALPGCRCRGAGWGVVVLDRPTCGVRQALRL